MFAGKVLACQRWMLVCGGRQPKGDVILRPQAMDPELPRKSRLRGQPDRDPSGLSESGDPMDIALTQPRTLGDSGVRDSVIGEREMIQACCAGDERAMEVLYHSYRRRVFGVIARIVGISDAPEVAQEAFLRIYRGLHKFRGDSALGTWVYRLSVNAALSHRARRAKRREISDEILADLPAPEPELRDPRLAKRLQWAMDQLPAGYRAVLVLHDVDGLSHEECAAILGCRVGTSKSQLHKARARMRQLLGAELREQRAKNREGR